MLSRDARDAAPRTVVLAAVLCLATVTGGAGWVLSAGTARADGQAGAEGQVGRMSFALEQPVPEDGGGIFVHDLNGDGRLDFVVTSDGHIGAYDNSGRKLWVRKDDLRLFEYAHHPSAIAGDMDGDGEQEVAYLTAAYRLVIANGRTGAVEKTLDGLGKPVAVAIANLRGLGDRDILVQYSQTEVAAVAVEDGRVLWRTDEYRGIEHSPLRQADIDGDGLDEVAGASFLDHDGKRMNTWDLGGAYRNMDSMVIADIVPGLPLEAALAEQRGDQSHTDVVNPERIVFRALNPWNWEDPDKVAVGDFDPEKPGLEVFNRSSGGDGVCPRSREEPYRYEEGPWVLDAAGRLLAKYYVNDKKPSWWTGHGLEEVCRIDWDGDTADELVAKERHKNGAGAIVDAMTGEFRQVFEVKATRIYAADVRGDSREEVIVVDESGEVRVFWDARPNPGPGRPSPWTQQHYRRQKQNWNYYSP